MRTLLMRSLRNLSLLFVFLLCGCGSLSTDEEQELGEELVGEINASNQLIEDSEVLSYIREIADRLTGARTPMEQDLNFRVIDSPVFNAFAVAGGNIYLTRGTILASRNVAELASVMAHEIAHVTEGHISRYYRRYRNSRTMAELAGVTLAIATGNPFIVGAGDMAANLGSAVYISRHSRANETGADLYALEMLLAAGFDPRSQVTLFARINAEMINAETPLPFLQTHPLPSERMAEIQARLRSTPMNNLQVNDGNRLREIQSRLLN